VTVALTDSRNETVEAIRRQVNSIGDPCSVAVGTPMGIEDMGLIERIDLDQDGNVLVALRLTSPCCMNVGYFDVETRKRVLQVPGVRSVEVITDRGLDWDPSMMSDDAKRRRRESLLRRGFPAV
jgi:metal-sulfur cluster biosynthetic enzyme